LGIKIFQRLFDRGFDAIVRMRPVGFNTASKDVLIHIKHPAVKYRIHKVLRIDIRGMRNVRIKPKITQLFHHRSYLRCIAGKDWMAAVIVVAQILINNNTIPATTPPHMSVVCNPAMI